METNANEILRRSFADVSRVPTRQAKASILGEGMHPGNSDKRQDIFVRADGIRGLRCKQKPVCKYSSHVTSLPIRMS